MKKNGRTMKMKRKRRNSQYKNTIFPLLLAALCSKPPNRRALIAKCLKKLLLSLSHVDLSPILSLLPSLLKFDSSADIVCRSAEIIGGASLASFEMNEKICVEDEIVKGLISLLRSSKREISMAACNAVLDLATTAVGRRRLLEFSAAESFILCFVQEPMSLDLTVSHASDNTLMIENEYGKSLLQGSITLINSCTIEQLQSIPTELSENFIVYLNGIWRQAHNRRLCSTPNKNVLAECIFRLSITHDLHQERMDIEQIKKNIFDSGGISMEHFLSDSWEISPVLIKASSRFASGQNDNFGPLFQFLDLKEGISAFLHSLLKNIISCPTNVSDELDILNIIDDIKGHLGYPITYNQDIRVVKTGSDEKELHYFDAHHVFDMDDILRCGEAFKEGYTIALRGMEFRYKFLADIADGFASLFGQPSSGINMYLTPLNSQGLAKHSDDHCVFVCQLIGAKKWKIYGRQDLCLPRLYENCSELCSLESGIDGCQEFVVKEGDVLYIPRGFPHEARTDVYGDQNVEDGAGFSLHLTLAVEIEPPFEWEGFMHVALYSWDEKTKPFQCKSSDTLRVAMIRLLHISIKLIGNLNPDFRKACLVGATPSEENSRLLRHQTTFFRSLITRIATGSNFSDSFEYLEATLRKNEDPFEHVRWMKRFTETCKVDEACNVFDILVQDRDAAEAVFMEVKSKFCDEVESEDVEMLYRVLLEKYRKVRKQYINGMVSLHSALHGERGIALS